MAGRSQGQTQQVLEHISAMLENLVQDKGIEPAKDRGLTTFKKNQPSKFHGNFNPEGAKFWLSETEKIFEAMGCLEEHKVTHATLMLLGEAEN